MLTAQLYLAYYQFTVKNITPEAAKEAFKQAFKSYMKTDSERNKAGIERLKEVKKSSDGNEKMEFYVESLLLGGEDMRYVREVLVKFYEEKGNFEEAKKYREDNENYDKYYPQYRKLKEEFINKAYRAKLEMASATMEEFNSFGDKIVEDLFANLTVTTE